MTKVHNSSPTKYVSKRKKKVKILKLNVTAGWQGMPSNSWAVGVRGLDGVLAGSVYPT